MSKAIAKVFCLTKNEYDMIEDFLIYYGSIFGFNNIVVIDNQSTDQRVLDIYSRYTDLGVVIHTETRNMRHMGSIMSDYMNRYKSECDFMFPVDTDEFIFIQQENIVDVGLIHSFLRSLDPHTTQIKYQDVFQSEIDPTDSSYVNHMYHRPIQEITNFSKQNIDKVFVRSSGFVDIHIGNHRATTSYGNMLVTPYLGLLHYTNTGPKRRFERCIMSIQGYGQLDLKQPVHTMIDQIVNNKLYHDVGGHRVGEYMFFIMRLFIVHVYYRCYGEYPTTALVDQIIDVYKENGTSTILFNHITSLYQDRKPVQQYEEKEINNHLAANIVYHVAKTEHPFKIDVVKNYIHRINKI